MFFRHGFHRLTQIGIFEPVGNDQINNAFDKIKIRAIGVIRVLFLQIEL